MTARSIATRAGLTRRAARSKRSSMALNTAWAPRRSARAWRAVTAALQLPSSGDHAVVGYDCYLSTYHLFANDLPRYGITATFVDLTDLAAVERAIAPNTRMIWIETPTNPLLDVVDLAAIARIARAAGALTVVDNTFASPYCQNPLDWGIDLVVHSTTKYLGGHSDLLGGAVIARTPELAARIADRQYYLGAIPSPFDC
jgi:cystathionine beta-lyase/cystathionine gamma-synthase